MAWKRRVIWTDEAKLEFKSICDYWNKRNKSLHYSKKLRRLTRQALERVVDFPLSGSSSDFDDIKFLIIEDYCLFYTVSQNDLLVLSFWDGRQNPEKLKTRLE